MKLNQKHNQDYLSMMNNLIYKPVTDKIFKSIQKEGFDDYIEDFYDVITIQKDFYYDILPITKKEKEDLKLHDKFIINKIIQFDYELIHKQKEQLMIKDLVDFKKGEIYIIKYKKP